MSIFKRDPANQLPPEQRFTFEKGFNTVVGATADVAGAAFAKPDVIVEAPDYTPFILGGLGLVGLVVVAKSL